MHGQFQADLNFHKPLMKNEGPIVKMKSDRSPNTLPLKGPHGHSPNEKPDFEVKHID